MYQNCYAGMPNVQSNPYPIMPNQSPVVMNFRFVDRPEDITPNYIPMNGDLGVFPLRDQSAILTKQWKSDGSIETIKYIPERHTVTEAKTDPVVDKLDEILKILHKKEASG